MDHKSTILGTLTNEQRRRIRAPRRNLGAIVRMIERNRGAGYAFFEDSTLRYWDSHIHAVFEGPGGVYLVDSIQYHNWAAGVHGPREYKVRRQELSGRHAGAFVTVAECPDLQTALETAEYNAKGEDL